MKSLHRRQRGAHTAEFAIAGGIFLVLLLAAIEFGRLLFAWQVLDESSRRAARLAAVCPIGNSGIAHAAVFNDPGTPGESPILSGLTDSDVVIEYLDGSGNVLTNPTGNFDNIRFVRATLHGYTHTLLIPFFMNTFTLPDVSTVLPRESLGISPQGTGCFGTIL